MKAGKAAMTTLDSGTYVDGPVYPRLRAVCMAAGRGFWPMENLRTVPLRSASNDAAAAVEAMSRVVKEVAFAFRPPMSADRKAVLRKNAAKGRATLGSI